MTKVVSFNQNYYLSLIIVGLSTINMPVSNLNNSEKISQVTLDPNLLKSQNIYM